MPDTTVQFLTISPIELVPLLRAGASDFSPGYGSLIDELAALDQNVQVYHHGSDEQQYQQLVKDVYDARILSWSYDTSVGPIVIHLYAGSVAVADFQFTLPSADSAILEAQAQTVTRKAIDEAYPHLRSLLLKLADQSHSKLLDQDRIRSILPSPKIMWTARTLLLQSSELERPGLQHLLQEWLCDTGCPDDARAIIERERDYSMTWLNYVIVNLTEEDYRQETMVLAQYYYAAQEVRNRELKAAISVAYTENQLRLIEQLLSQSRVEARLRQIQYHEHLKLLTRMKRKLLEDILQGWEFPLLVENGERMIEICSSRLEEADHKRRERSTVLTDLLLVTLSFFAVFELCLYLVELSREMMSRPALDYTDESSSFFLSAIASIDTDIMFVFGAGLTVVLVICYKRIKDS